MLFAAVGHGFDQRLVDALRAETVWLSARAAAEAWAKLPSRYSRISHQTVRFGIRGLSRRNDEFVVDLRFGERQMVRVSGDRERIGRPMVNAKIGAS
jgi:hypothetical protein